MTNRQIELYEQYKAKNWLLPKIAKQIKVSVRNLEEYENELFEDKQRLKFVELRSEGRSIKYISEKLSISLDEVIELSETIKPDDLANFKTVAIDKIQTKYFVSKEKRIEIFGEIFIAIRQALQNRSLDDIPTEKLLILFLKYGEFLKNNEVKIELKREEVDEYGRKDTEKWSI